MVRRRRRGEPGRLKWKLSDMLQAQGYPVSPYDIDEAKGYWRSSPYSDCYRWEARLIVPGTSLTGRISCWETMTEVCKRGLVVVADQRGIFGKFDAYAHEEEE